MPSSHPDDRHPRPRAPGPLLHRPHRDRPGPPGEGPTSYLGLRIGDSELGIVADGSVESAPSGRVLLSIEVADVDAALARVESLGGRAPAPATDMPWGQRVAHVQDPDGNAGNLTTTTG